jgi:hypothetical protein
MAGKQFRVGEDVRRIVGPEDDRTGTLQVSYAGLRESETI